MADQAVPASGTANARAVAPSSPTSERPERASDLPGVERLLSLSDGVVAIALTLIIFQFRIPTIKDSGSASELLRSLGSVGTELGTYVVAFFVIGQFWLAHHRTFRHIRGHDEGLAWLNFVFLFTISIMPFTSNLMGRYNNNPVAIDLFAANLMLASLATQGVVLYGRRRHLIAAEEHRAELAAGVLRSAGVVIITAASMGLAWFSTAIAQYLWLVLILLPVIGGRVERSVTSRSLSQS